MPKRLLAMPIGTFVALVAMTGRLPLSARFGFACAGMVLLVWGIGPLLTSSRPVPADHLQRASTTSAPAPPAPASASPMFDSYPTAPTPPPGVDPATGEVLDDQPASSAGAEADPVTPSPCPANTPDGADLEPIAALALGMPVRWATATRTGLGQVVDIGTEAAEIRPLWPCASKQVTVELGRIVPISPLELAEALA